MPRGSCIRAGSGAASPAARSAGPRPRAAAPRKPPGGAPPSPPRASPPRPPPPPGDARAPSRSLPARCGTPAPSPDGRCGPGTPARRPAASVPGPPFGTAGSRLHRTGWARTSPPSAPAAPDNLAPSRSRQCTTLQPVRPEQGSFVHPARIPACSPAVVRLGLYLLSMDRQSWRTRLSPLVPSHLSFGGSLPTAGPVLPDMLPLLRPAPPAMGIRCRRLFAAQKEEVSRQ